MPSVSAHLAHTLAASAHHAFGVMGNGNVSFLDEASRTSLPFTAVRHEAGGVAAADAYWRVSGRLAVATATYGAGFTNTLTPLAEAVQAHTPLVLVVGDAPVTGARPWDVDQLALAEAVGARTFRLGVDDAAARTADAVRHALAARTAVVVAVPYDLVTRDAGPLVAHPVPAPEPVAPQDEALEPVVAALRSARRPLLLAGRGAWDAGAGAELGLLADALGAVTATTALARSLFPRAEFDLGVAGGFGQEQAMALVREADVALVVGAGLNPFTMRFGALFAPTTRVLQVDITDGPTHPRVDGFVRGDARLVARRLRLDLERPAPSGWRESLSGFADGSLRRRDPGVGVCVDGLLDPRSVAARLAELLPEDRVVVSDGGHFLGWANTYWPVASPDRMIMVGTAYQTIGLGLPSVVGAAAARPGATVVLTTGDGGALMALADLESAVRCAPSAVIVVWNDAAYGAEVHVHGAQGLAQEPMLIPRVDFAALADAVGATGRVVRRPADLDALESWRADGARGTLLLDCHVSRSVVAPYQQEIAAATRAAR